MNVTFLGFNCRTEWHQYQSGAPALRLVVDGDASDEVLDGEPVTTVTVNVPGRLPAPGEVFIKDWSEHKGIVEALVEAGIIEQPRDAIPVGNFDASAQVCRLTPAALAELYAARSTA